MILLLTLALGCESVRYGAGPTGSDSGAAVGDTAGTTAGSSGSTTPTNTGSTNTGSTNTTSTGATCTGTRPETTDALTTTNSAGRTGTYYLPEGWNQGPIPLLVAYHGSGGDGMTMINMFGGDARARGFAIIAPDSRVDPTGGYNWEVGTHPGEVTEDWTHTMNCIDEVLALGLEFDPAFVMAAGHSGGASSAPYIATNEEMFTACASLHGGVFPDGLGDNDVPCWFSTGKDDKVRTPDHVEGQAQSMRDAGFSDVEFRLYSGGHDVSQQEREELLIWWLDG